MLTKPSLQHHLVTTNSFGFGFDGSDVGPIVFPAFRLRALSARVLGQSNKSMSRNYLCSSELSQRLVCCDSSVHVASTLAPKLIADRQGPIQCLRSVDHIGSDATGLNWKLASTTNFVSLMLPNVVRDKECGRSADNSCSAFSTAGRYWNLEWTGQGNKTLSRAAQVGTQHSLRYKWRLQYHLSLLSVVEIVRKVHGLRRS